MKTVDVGEEDAVGEAVDASELGVVVEVDKIACVESKLDVVVVAAEETTLSFDDNVASSIQFTPTEAKKTDTTMTTKIRHFEQCNRRELVVVVSRGSIISFLITLSL